MNPWAMEKIVASHLEELRRAPDARRAAWEGKRAWVSGPGVAERLGVALIRAGIRLAGPEARPVGLGAATAGRLH